MGSKTLKQKQEINDHVTAETKRCFSIVRDIVLNTKFQVKDSEDARGIAIVALSAIIKGSPYVEFRPDLEKLLLTIPKE